MKDVKSIILGLENCENIEIESKYIGLFLIKDIHQIVGRIACNSISKYDEVGTVAVEIYKESNLKEYYPFGSNCDRVNIFERLNKFKDITSISLVYDDDSKEDYWVVFNEEDDQENDYQKNYISDLGNLYIVVSKTEGISEYFNLEEINDEEMVNFQKRMVLN